MHIVLRHHSDLRRVHFVRAIYHADFPSFSAVGTRTLAVRISHTEDGNGELVHETTETTETRVGATRRTLEQ